MNNSSGLPAISNPIAMAFDRSDTVSWHPAVDVLPECLGWVVMDDYCNFECVLYRAIQLSKCHLQVPFLCYQPDKKFMAPQGQIEMRPFARVTIKPRKTLEELSLTSSLSRSVVTARKPAVQ